MSTTDAWTYLAASERCDAPNPIVATRLAPDGGTARLYLNGMVDATDGTHYALSPGFESYDELVRWAANYERELGRSGLVGG